MVDFLILLTFQPKAKKNFFSNLKMDHFLIVRGLSLVPKHQILLKYKKLRESVHIDNAELNYPLGSVLNENAHIYVVENQLKQQIFLILVKRDNQIAYGKKILQDLLFKLQHLAPSIVILNFLSAQAQSLQKTSDTSKHHVQLCLRDQVVASKLKSRMVNSYQILEEDEIKQVEKDYQTTRDHFPYMFETDPIAIYLGLKKDQVIKSVGTKDIKYRLVVST